MGSGCIDPHFLDLGTSWRWVVNLTPLPLYPGERAPGTHWIGGWMDLRADLDNSVVQPVASHYTNYAIPARYLYNNNINFANSAVNAKMFINLNHTICFDRPPLWSSGQSSWLQIQRPRVWFPVLSDFLRSSGSRTGSTYPRGDNWGATWMET
jgi:hypothetical protein